MKGIKYRGEDDMLQKGVTVLMKELGPVETVRFMNISRKKRAESVKRHI
ncbi:MAG TPA: hypothetical protein PKM65_00490 [Spirochaetota bacterium]|nr:hypothetical protein [Spirochaetota bacterium]HNT11704.1 hypothetical protein [Spirochaetota bacterium]